MELKDTVLPAPLRAEHKARPGENPETKEFQGSMCDQDVTGFKGVAEAEKARNK